jgi:hypothetical protein
MLIEDAKIKAIENYIYGMEIVRKYFNFIQSPEKKNIEKKTETAWFKR